MQFQVRYVYLEYETRVQLFQTNEGARSVDFFSNGDFVMLFKMYANSFL